MDIRDRWKVITLALALDLAVGEPDERWHPVVWMGKLVAWLERRAPRSGGPAQLAYGIASELGCLLAAGLPARGLEALSAVRWPLGVLLQAALLKPTFAARALFDSVGRVERALDRGDLPEARWAVGRIVSRPVDRLDESELAAAAVESLAENSSDSVVAPLLFYAVFGLPGAYCYRMANTLDAMWGYRGHYEYLGKAAARLDDLTNLLPSRLTALSVAAVSAVVGGSPGRAWDVARRDSARTASPNAGWPMAALAGALDLRLEKTDHYVLNPEGRSPQPRDVARARLVVGAGLAATLLGIILAVWRRPGGDPR